MMAAGPQGPQGQTGPQGFQGNQGVQGAQGNQGNQGAQGPQGTQGFQGFQGHQGNQGNAGYTGVRGAQGDPAGAGSSVAVPMAVHVIPGVPLWYTTPFWDWVTGQFTATKLTATAVGITRPLAVTRLGLGVYSGGTSANQARIGVYANGPTGPEALVLDAGNVATNASAVLREIVLGTPLPLQPGVYWLAVQYQGSGTAPQVYSVNTGNNSPGCLGRATMNGAPIIGASVDNTGNVPAIGTPLPDPWPATGVWTSNSLPVVGFGVH